MGSPTLSLAKPDTSVFPEGLNQSHCWFLSSRNSPGDEHPSSWAFPFPSFTPTHSKLLSQLVEIGDAVLPELAPAEGEMQLQPHGEEESGAQPSATSVKPRHWESPISKDTLAILIPSLGTSNPRSSVGSPSYMSDDGRAGLAPPSPRSFVPEKKGRRRTSLLPCFLPLHRSGEKALGLHLALALVLSTAPQAYPVPSRPRDCIP